MEKAHKEERERAQKREEELLAQERIREERLIQEERLFFSNMFKEMFGTQNMPASEAVQYNGSSGPQVQNVRFSATTPPPQNSSVPGSQPSLQATQTLHQPRPQHSEDTSNYSVPSYGLHSMPESQNNVTNTSYLNFLYSNEHGNTM